MKFSYKGRNASGALVAGTIAADTQTEAITLIRDSGVVPIIVEKKKGGSVSINIGFGNRVSLADRIIFTKNLAGMLRAGLPLARALQVLGKQTSNAFFKSIIVVLIDTIDKGGTLSEGLAKYPKVFSSLFVSMVKSGEESGGLPAALLEVGSNLEKSYALNRKIKSALMYPSIILIAMVIIGILMFIYIVPTLISTFKSLGVTLPLSTRIVVAISDIVTKHLLLLVGGMVLVVGGLYLASKQPRTKRMLDYLSIKLPGVGPLVREINAARTARTLSSLISSDVDISRSISITRDVLQNSYYKDMLSEVEAVIQRGEPISRVFQSHLELYPVMVGEMVEVGEETGRLAGMLGDIATFYENEVDAKTKDLSTIIEPVLMIFIGGAVGFFAVSMLTPLYTIMNNIN